MTFLVNHQDKRLCEVTIPGSHDAGVSTGRWNVQTQTNNLGLQLQAGCRFFDIRVAAKKSGSGAGATMEARTYHLDHSMVKSKAKKNPVGLLSTKQDLRGLGGWGESLDAVLTQARTFISNPTNHSEFVILKFSKCFNWKYIAEACIATLGANPSVHYMGGGNLNTTKVSALKGKVITLFPQEAYGEIEAHCYAMRPHGLLYYKELYVKGAAPTPYQPNPPSFVNMQYFGKFSSTSNKKKNTLLQRQTLLQNSGSHPDCLGMMYWTTTGLLGNILSRNDGMWTGPGRAALKKTWKVGLAASINDRLVGGHGNLTRQDLDFGNGVARNIRIECFMPNIVMMDDVDTDKCKVIQELNGILPWELRNMLPP